MPRAAFKPNDAASGNLDAWQETLGSRFAPMEAEPLGDRSRFHGQMRAEPVADLELSIVSGSGQIVRRTRRLVQRNGGDLYKVGVQLRGQGLVQQDGRIANLSAGDLTVYDTARPYELVFDRDFEMLVLVVPRRRLATRVPGLEQHTALAISGRHGSGALTSSLLRGLDHRSAQHGVEAAYLAEAAVDLVAACLAGCSDLGAATPSDTLLVAADRYIDDHLTDPELSPAQVAAAVHVSLRLLQRPSNAAAAQSAARSANGV